MSLLKCYLELFHQLSCEFCKEIFDGSKVNMKQFVDYHYNRLGFEILLNFQHPTDNPIRNE